MICHLHLMAARTVDIASLDLLTVFADHYPDSHRRSSTTKMCAKKMAQNELKFIGKLQKKEKKRM